MVRRGHRPHPGESMLGGEAYILSGGGRDGSQQTMLAGGPRGAPGSKAGATALALSKALRKKYGSRLSLVDDSWTGFNT